MFWKKSFVPDALPAATLSIYPGLGHQETLECAPDGWLLEMKMREGRLRWYGHIMRKDQEYVRRRMIEMELPGKRKSGRLKRRFLHAVKEDRGKLVRQRWILKTGRCGETSYAVATPN